MREIKFRAWDKNSKLMFFNVQDTYDMLGHHWPEEFGEWAPEEIRDKYNLSESSFGDLLTEEAYILMQFTGLKDSNGKDVYEGDVLQHPGEGEVERGLVIYSDEFAMFKCRDGREPAYDLWDSVSMAGRIVVGNVWEHPDLLK